MKWKLTQITSCEKLNKIDMKKVKEKRCKDCNNLKGLEQYPESPSGYRSISCNDCRKEMNFDSEGNPFPLKKCSKCKTEKMRSDFYKEGARLRTECRECQSEIRKMRKKENGVATIKYFNKLVKKEWLDAILNIRGEKIYLKDLKENQVPLLKEEGYDFILK